MKKLLAIVVLGLLWSGNAYAVKYKSISNFYIDIPEEYYLSSSLSPEKILEYSPNEEDRKDLISYSKRATKDNIEMIFTKEKMLLQYKNVGGATSEVIGIFQLDIRWNKDWRKNCNDQKIIFEAMSKESKKPLKSFNCENYPHKISGETFKNSNILYQYIDPNFINDQWSAFRFRHPISKKIIWINLVCEKSCEDMRPVFKRIIDSITLN